MSITKSELMKYKIYVDKRSMDAVAEKLKISTTSVSEAVRNLERKIEDSITNLRIGLELGLPFERIDKIEIAHKLALVFDETKEVLSLPKEQVVKLEDACKFKEIKAEGIRTWQDFVKKAIEEKYAEFKKTKLLK